ncbi:hypothetical protein [Polaribacter tangerinus]|uniref:hypothetical protein n=1 Tax=Polaribacter tangerinus TaxID=1920034 RepID=UPI00117DF14F|nr:hypothetical protein [Polaribacter tangerinus]
MKSLKYYLLIIVLLKSNIFIAQQVVEAIETVAPATTETIISENNTNVPKIYKNGEHILVGNIENELYVIKNVNTNLQGIQDKNGTLFFTTKKMLIENSKYPITISKNTGSISHQNKTYFYSSGKLKEE